MSHLGRRRTAGLGGKKTPTGPLDTLGVWNGWKADIAFDHFQLHFSVMSRLPSVLVTLSGLGLTGCGHQTATAIFQDVASSTRWDGAGEVVRTYPNKEAVPRYLVGGGRLLLLVQVTQEGLLVTYVDQPDWDRRKLADLRAKHAELGGYLSEARWPSTS
jgi:hypothetical protein